MDELEDCDLDQSGGYEDTTVGDVHESIETNIWLAQAYFSQQADGLARECLRAAWYEYVRFNEILGVYAGAALGDRLRKLMVDKCDDLLRELSPLTDREVPGFAVAGIAA